MNCITIKGRFANAEAIRADKESGLITDIIKNQHSMDVTIDGDVILPGDFNAHSHPEQSIYVEIADPAWELAKWCRETIYKYSVEMDAERVYYGCVRAFSRMLSYGETSVMVSFYCHNRRGNELDRAVIKAAKDVGIRLFFGRMNYDIITEGAYKEKQDSQRSYFESPQEAEKNFLELLSEECATVKIAPALHSFHANTIEAIVKGINLGAEHHRKIQFHLSEDEGDVKLCLAQFGKRPVEVLADLLSQGKISRLDHMVLSDCVWTNDHEKELIKEHGMAVVMDGRMNDRVKAGRADVKKYLAMEIPLYVGTDGEASNDDLSIKNEREWLMRTHALAKEDMEKLSDPFEMAGVKVGTLTKGAAADFQVYKDGRLNELYVGGVKVMQNGRLTAEPLAQKAEAFINGLFAEKTNA